MQIEKSYDKLEISMEEIQEAVKALVRSKTGRDPRGDIAIVGSFTEDKVQRKYANTGKGFCYLEDLK